MSIYIFNYKNFKFNPLRPPPGCDPMVWMQAIINVFAQAYWLMAGVKGILQDHLYKLYSDYGVFDGRDAYPCMHDLLESVNRHLLERKYGREADFLESAKNRLRECITPLGNMFDCDRGYPIEELLEKNVVFELEGLLSENQTFLVNAILRYIFQYKLSNRNRG